MSVKVNVIHLSSTPSLFIYDQRREMSTFLLCSSCHLHVKSKPHKIQILEVPVSEFTEESCGCCQIDPCVGAV